VKSVIPVCKRKRESEHLFWREVTAVNLSNETSLTSDYVAQLLKKRDNKDALKIFSKPQTFN
jgi:hypothetical protein